MINMVKLPTNNKRMILRVARGHFATSHSHINYYIDVTMQKTRLSEAAETAKELVHMYKTTTIVDTILCPGRHPGDRHLHGQRADQRRLPQHERPPDHLHHHPRVHFGQPDHPAGQHRAHGAGPPCADLVGFHHHRLLHQGRPWRRCNITAGRWRAWRPSLPPPTNSWGCGSTPFSTPITSPTTRATNRATALCAKPASPSTRW